MLQSLECFSKSNPWIIDSDTSDHMTSDITLFHSYQPCFESYKIKIAYGSFSLVASQGSVILPNSFRLLFVLEEFLNSFIDINRYTPYTYIYTND